MRFCDCFLGTEYSVYLMSSFLHCHTVLIVWQCKSDLKGWKSLPAPNCLTENFFCFKWLVTHCPYSYIVRIYTWPSFLQLLH